MPRKTPNLFFRIFDKIFVVVAFALLLFVLYSVVTKSKIKQEKDPRVQIEQYVQKIKQGLKEPATAYEPVPYLTKVQETLQPVPESEETVRRWVLHRPRPIIYDQPALIGLGKVKLIKFRKPLDEGTVKADPKWMAEVLHPVQGKPLNIVQVRAGDREGAFLLTGREGPREHKVPCIVGKDIDRVVEPPKDLVAEATRGRIDLSWDENPDNKRGKLKVVEYYIYRKRLRDVVAEFEQVATVQARESVAQAQPAGQQPAGGQPEPAPGVGGGRWPGAQPAAKQPQPEKKKAYVWTDENVEPDEAYLYRVRTKAQYSYPDVSEYTPIVEARTPPDVDFQFNGGTALSARFTVFKFENGEVYEHEFKIGVGDEIGGIVEVKEANRQVDFRTGCVLLDFHTVRGPTFDRKKGTETGREGRTQRIVYKERDGDASVRWRYQVVAQELVNETVEKPRDETMRPDRDGVILRPDRGR